MNLGTALGSASALVALTILGGCSDESSRGPVSPSEAMKGMRQPVLPPGIPHSEHRRSWIARDAASARQLLFETDPGTNAVAMFALPGMKQVGSISGLDFPTGACADARGNVWIANFLKHELLEYSHGGKYVTKIVRSHLHPYSCAVNPANGDIAVMDWYGPQSRPGEVLVYSQPSAQPTVLRNPVVYDYYYGAYDSNGTLWFDGSDALGHTVVSKCAASSCNSVVLSGGSIFSGGSVLWDSARKKLVVFDLYCHFTPATCSYPVSASGVVGAPTLYFNSEGGVLCSLIQATFARIGGRRVVVGADNEFGCGNYYSSTIDLWPYPAGGLSSSYDEGAVIYPWGAAVSTR